MFPSTMGLPGQVFIDVWNLRAIVSRYVQNADGSISFVPASNAEEIEERACEAILDQGGGYNISGHYRCPDELAAQAIWPAQP